MVSGRFSCVAPIDLWRKALTRKIPDRIPARYGDMLNDAMSTVYVPQIHLMLEFEGRLDRERMARALRLCLDAEPVLGCRFVPRWIRPYWVRLSEDALDQASLLREVTGDADVFQKAEEEFLADVLDGTRGPQIKALLFSGEGKDRLLVKINHQVADAGGIKEFGYLLGSLYRKIAEEPGFRPVPNFGSRSMRQVYNRFLPRRFFGIMRRYFRDIASTLFPYKSLAFPSGSEKKGAPAFVFKRFGAERVRELRSFGGRTGATLNDLVVTAMLRALVRLTGWTGDGALRMAGAVDLRRYIPGGRGAALCNLSSFYFPTLGGELGDGFDETLAGVKARIDAMKPDYLGLGFLFGGYLQIAAWPFAMKKAFIRGMFANAIRTGNTSPAMTNLGPIEDAPLDFGAPRVSAAEVVVPSACPPLFVSGLSGFRDTLTLSAGFFESAIPRSRVEEFFSLVDEELPG